MPYKLPENEISKLKLLMKNPNLNMGSIDLLVDYEYNYHFLEVNPFDQIEWLAEECFPNLHYNKCNLYPICGGSCPKHWYDGQIPCPSFKWNIEDRLKLYYKSTLLK